MTATDSAAGRDKYCGGQKRQTEGLCERPAGWGTQHVGVGRCKLHGGNTPSHVKAAQQIQAAELAERYSVPREVHPLTGVMEQYHRYAGQVAFLERKVNQIPDEDLMFGVSEIVDRRGPGAGNGSDDDSGERLRTGSAAEYEVKRKAGPNAWLEQFDKVQREYARLGIDIVKIGLESAANAERSKVGAELAALVQGVVDDTSAAVAERFGVDTVEAKRLIQPLAVARVARFAGAPAVEGAAAA